MSTVKRSVKKQFVGFTLLYALLTAALAGGSYYWVDNMLRQQITKLGETGNIVLAQGFAQSIWPRFGEYVKSMQTGDGDMLRERPETAELRELTANLAQDKPVLKLKIYNVNGLTVYSSDESQIGESKRGNFAFERTAKQGELASKMSERGEFSGFSGVISNVALAETYVPVRNSSGEIEGVFELYTNVSSIFFASQQQVKQFLFLVISLCVAGYVIILMTLILLRERQQLVSINEENQEASLRQQIKTLQQQLASRGQELQLVRQYLTERTLNSTAVGKIDPAGHRL